MESKLLVYYKGSIITGIELYIGADLIYKNMLLIFNKVDYDKVDEFNYNMVKILKSVLLEQMELGTKLPENLLLYLDNLTYKGM